MPSIRDLLVSGLMAWAIVGCQHRPPLAAPGPLPAAPAAAPQRQSAPVPPPTARSEPVPALTEDEIFRRKSLDQLNAEHPLTDAFFGYDSAALTEEDKLSLQADARWLSRWSSTRVRVDGHCDERGSGEYNLALGDRRAQAVRNYLVALGIQPGRLETRSLGKEAPLCAEAREECWARNRRGLFVVTAK